MNACMYACCKCECAAWGACIPCMDNCALTMLASYWTWLTCQPFHTLMKECGVKAAACIPSVNISWDTLIFACDARELSDGLSHTCVPQKRDKPQTCSCCRGSGEVECQWCHGTGERSRVSHVLHAGMPCIVL